MCSLMQKITFKPGMGTAIVTCMIKNGRRMMFPIVSMSKDLPVTVLPWRLTFDDTRALINDVMDHM